jgi:NAD(P)-dependent dehydrogenase (short-subunit alcohol dehydrogenase family)
MTPPMPPQFFAHDILAGRVALVTGASRGLGRHFAHLLASHGATVAALARDADALAALVAEIAASGGPPASALRADVRDAASIDRALDELIERHGRLDIVVNNAGVASTRAALATGDDDWNGVIDTNLSGPFRVARGAARLMGERGGGVIVNIASVLALRVAKQVPAYVAAKAALVKLTEALALEWAPQKIRVNALAPGYIVTDLNRAFLRSPAGEAMEKRIPMRRFGEPDDLDGALLLLASDAGRYINGTTLLVDGGHALAWL